MKKDKFRPEGKPDFYTIGQVSQMTGISPSTLRFYEKLGLFDSFKRDESNHYRYYSQKEVQEAYMLQRMKNWGFRSNEIKDFLSHRGDVDYIENAFREKTAFLEQQIRQLQEQLQYTKNTQRLLSLALRLSEENAEGENTCFIRKVPERTVLGIRRNSRIIVTELFWERCEEIFALQKELKLSACGYCTAVFHDYYLNQFFYETGDLEILLPVETDDLSLHPSLKKIPAVTVASTIYEGPYQDMLQVYIQLVNFIEKNNYKIIGPSMEEYLVEFSYGVDEEHFVTRISFPVSR